MDCTGLVFDTTCLSHFAIADRVDVLGDLVKGLPCHSTTLVLEEVRRGAARHEQLRAIFEQEWITVQRIDASIERLAAFVRWTERIGSGNDRDLGEASVLAVAAELGATAVVDDLAAKKVACITTRKCMGRCGCSLKPGRSAKRPKFRCATW